jgi:glutathione S-transferase
VGGVVQDQHRNGVYGPSFLAGGPNSNRRSRLGTKSEEAVAALETKLEIAELQLTNHAYLAGPDFTLADIQFGHILYRYFDIDINRADLPRLHRYYHRLTERSAFREHVMVSYEELRCR